MTTLWARDVKTVLKIENYGCKSKCANASETVQKSVLHIYYDT